MTSGLIRHKADLKVGLYSQLGALAVYTVLAVLQTWPLTRHLDTHLPGLGLGDNVSFVWNLWWMREAIASSAWRFFDSPLLFAPLGTPLVLHTHTAALALVAAILLAPLSIVTAQNLLLIVSLALNGWSVWLLARRVSGDAAASFIAGVIVLMSPLVATRLMGHFNLVVLWPLVLACLAFVTWWERVDWRSAIWLGLAAGLLPFFDYYLSIYFLAFVASLAAASSVALGLQRAPRSGRVATIVAAVIAVLALAGAVAIATTRRDVFTVAGIRVSARTPTNALTLAWLAALVAWAARWRWQVRMHVGRREKGEGGRETGEGGREKGEGGRGRGEGGPKVGLYRTAVLSLVVAAILISPLIGPAWRLWRSGGYVTQQSGLRSGPSGVDIATLMMPPPFHSQAGPLVRRLYERLAIDPMESSAYVGWAALFLAASAWRRRREQPEARQWGVVLAVFGVWALGPYLTLLGQNTGLILPGALLRFVPIVNNARIPGRALFMVAMCAAVMTAIALRRFERRRRRVTYGLVLSAVAVESLAAPLPLTALPPPGVYARVAADTSNAAVLPVPFGIRDGFGEYGLVETDALFEQTRHRHPIAGGFVARLPPDTIDWYASREPFASLLRLSTPATGAASVSCEVSHRGLDQAHVGFVVVYADASDALRRFVATLPVVRVEDDGQRVLYRVGRCK